MADSSPDETQGVGCAGSLFAAVREWQLWAVVGSVGLLFAPVLAGGGTLFFRDLYRQYIGTARLLSGFEHIGWLWEPLLHGGEPLLGNPNRALLYPSRLLYLVLDPVTALNWEIALHLIFAAAAGYLAARTFSLRREPAMVVGAVYALAGVPLSLTNHLLRALAYPWMAVALIAGHRWRAAPTRSGWFVVLVAALMVQGLTGTVETAICTVMLVTGWQLAGPRRFSMRARNALAVGGACVLGVAAAGVQVVPAAATVARSMRPITAEPGFLLAWSVHPARLLELWFPGILGQVDTATPAMSYWGAPLVDFGFPYVLSLYLGMATTVLVIVGLVTGEQAPLTARRRRMLACCVAAGVLMSLGRHLPGMVVLVEALGPLALVRFPVKALLLAALPAALLAGCGVDRMQAGNRRAVRLAMAMAAGLAGASILLWLAVACWDAFRDWLFQLLFVRADAMVTAGVSRSLLHGTIAVGSVALAVAVLRWARPALLGLVLAAVVTVDLAIAGLAVLPTAPRALLASAPPLEGQLRSNLHGGRLFRDRDPTVVHPRLAANTAAAAAGWWISVLDGELAANYGIPMVFHDDDAVVADRRIVLLTERVRQAPWERRLGPLTAAGVTLVMTADEPPIAALTHLVDVVTTGGPGYHLFRNSAAVAGAWWVDRAVTVSSPAEALAAVTGERFDPRREVVLEDTPEGVSGLRRLPAWATLEQAIDDLHVAVPAAGYIVFSETWNPGWRVEMDGRELPLLRANYAFSAVAVDGGSHRVRRVFRPPEVTLGLWLTTAALCLVVVVSGVGITGAASRRRQTKGEPTAA
jgi:hypothetical protein